MDHSGYPTLDKQPKSHFFIAAVFIRITDQNGKPVDPSGIFDRFDHGGKKWIPNIGHNHSDCFCVLGSERASDSVELIAGSLYCLEDAGTSSGGDHFRSIKCTRDRCGAEFQVSRKIVDLHEQGGGNDQVVIGSFWL